MVGKRKRKLRNWDPISKSWVFLKFQNFRFPRTLSFQILKPRISDAPRDQQVKFKSSFKFQFPKSRGPNFFSDFKIFSLNLNPQSLSKSYRAFPKFRGFRFRASNSARAPNPKFQDSKTPTRQARAFRAVDLPIEKREIPKETSLKLCRDR